MFVLFCLISLFLYKQKTKINRLGENCGREQNTPKTKSFESCGGGDLDEGEEEEVRVEDCKRVQGEETQGEVQTATWFAVSPVSADNTDEQEKMTREGKHRD